MATAGPNSTGTIASDASGFGGTAWVNPGNVASSNDVRAVATMVGDTDTEYLKATNFGFAIPTGATIDGITIAVEGRTTSGDLYGSSVFLVIGGTNQPGYSASGVAWGATDEVLTFGGVADTLGAPPLTGADVNDSGFGVAIYLAGDSAVIEIDHVTMTIHYTGGSSGPTTASKSGRSAATIAMGVI